MTDRVPEQSHRRTWLQALLVVLIFPVIAFSISLGVQAKYQSDVYSAAAAQTGRDLTDSERAGLDITELCATPDLAGQAVCHDIAIASVTRVVAILGAIVGLLLPLFIALVSARARRDRTVLIRVFVPGLYLTLAGLVVLVVLDGVLALASVYLGFLVFLGRIYPILLLAIAVGVLLGVVGIARAAIQASRRARTFVVAKRVAPDAEPALRGLIADVASEVGIEPPDQVLLGLDANFFVTEVDVVSTDGTWRGRSLFLSLPMSRILSTGELRAILGHEMGHFHGSDAAFSRRFYPVYRGAAGALHELASAGGNSGARSLALIPAVLVLGLFIDGFAVTERAMSRDRELAADQVGASLASPRDVASALVKPQAFAPLMEATLQKISTGRSPAIQNVGAAFIESVRKHATPKALEGLDQQALPHPTDSHPPLSQRLAALGLTETDVADAALNVDPRPAADAVIAHGSTIEVELTGWLGPRIAGLFPPRQTGPTGPTDPTEEPANV